MRPIRTGSLIGLLALVGCNSQEVFVAHNVPLDSSVETIPESQLLDVGIVVFDPGLPEGEIDKAAEEQLIAEGTFVQIRRAEALYFADQLKDSMQDSGHWGGVWVTPQASAADDLTVTAQILHSDGDIVKVRARAVDATGREWINDEYEMETAAGAFNRQRYPDQDPYEDLFNSISNDLAAVRSGLSDKEIEEIRTVSELRYAADLSPDAFGQYVTEDRSGTYSPARLPAAGDPLFERTLRIRQRERLFFDTLNQHYDNFSAEATTPYDGWREYSREEAIAIRELTRSSRWRTGLGIATILTSVVYGSQSNGDFTDRLVRDAMMYVGMDMIRTSAVRRQEKRLHSDMLEELAQSFDDEVEPLVVEMQGTEHRLTGTAEAQYAEWRDLLRQLFISETGFEPGDMNVYIEKTDPALDGGAAPAAGDTDTAAPVSDDTEHEEVISDAGGGASSGA
jgi:hypothetical protein